MGSKQNCLHSDRKQTVVLTAVIALLLVAISFITIVISNDGCSQLYSLVNSRYEYSAVQANPKCIDDYCVFSANIDFKLDESIPSVINAEVIMQSENTRYTDNVYWNAALLDNYEVAISSNIARRYGLSIGEYIVSKHIVDGELYEYRIAQIVPAVTDVRLSNNEELGDGVIIMGYDETYVSNMTHEHLVFSTESVNQLFDDSLGTLGDIVYRDSELIAVLLIIAPYLVLSITLSIIVIIVTMGFLNRSVFESMNRLIQIGINAHDVDIYYRKTMLVSALVASTVAMIISAVYIQFSGMSVLLIGYTVCIYLVEVVVILFEESRLRQKYWE